MKSKILLNTFLLVFLFSSQFLFAQIEGEVCGSSGSYSVPSTVMPVHTPGEGEFVRALFVYVLFAEDDFEGWGYSIWPNAEQSSNPIPNNPYTSDNKMVASEVQSKSTPFMMRYESYTVTDYFCQMSLGDFDLIGDEAYVTLPKSAVYYASHGFNRGSMNRLVLEYLNATQSIDWTRYNNWTLNGGVWEFGNTSDQKAEMIVITYRTIPRNNDDCSLVSPCYRGWFWDPQIGGEASLSIYPDLTFTNGGVNTTITGSTGVTCLNRGMATGRSELLMEHEIAHVMGFWHVDLGMMTPGHANTTFCMSPIERSGSNVEYISVPTVNTTSTHTLRDYIATGDALKIPLPGTSGEYFWITNNLKLSVYDGLSRGGKTCYETNFAEIDPYCPDGKGLFVYGENLGCSNTGGNVDIISAEGKFNYAYDRTVTIPPQNYEFFTTGGTWPLYKIVNGNRVNGYDEYKKAVGSSLGHQLITDDFCSDEGEYFLSWDDRGDGLDGFNMGYEEIFSPYSNPSTKTCNNSTNNGLTVRMLSQNARTGYITLKVYYNDDNLALAECPPSKPKYVKSEKIYFGGPGSSAFHPKITWDANIEPDFIDKAFNEGVATPYYEIWRGSSTDCNAEPTYTLLTTVNNSTTQYSDNAVTLYDPNHDETIGPCTSYPINYSYKIVAVDNRGMASLKSERALVKGYTSNCREEGQERPANGNEETKQYSINNFPNPFNPTTNIKYSLPKAGFVTIKVYDVVGRMIKELVSEFKDVGNYSVLFDGSSFASGIYFYRIETANFVDTKRMILVK